MSSARHLYLLCSHKLSEAYDAAQSVIQGVGRARFGRRYSPLAQDSSPSQGTSVSLRPTIRYVYAAACLLVVFGFAVYSRGGLYTHAAANATSRLSRADLSKNQYIAAVLRNPVEGLLDPEPIRQKCSETKFQEGLVWQCAAANGGIGNVANMVLNCVRYAVEAGATTLILPRISSRSGDLVDLGSQDRSVDMSYLLDADYFLSSWKLVCPQMRAVVSETEVPDLPSAPPHLAPSDVKFFQMRKYLIVDPTGWREAFDQWMATIPAFQNMSAEHPAAVWQDLVFAQWNREAHSPQFADSFPRLFRHTLQTRRLAASTLWGLEKKIGHPVVSDAIMFSSKTPLPSDVVNSLGPDRIASDGFLGAHLRVAADATAAGWPGYDAQAPVYIREAKRRRLTTIYLATGSAENRDKFRQDATREGLTVLVKEDLLDEDDLAELRSLTWDQQALVDFNVLLHSTGFAGFVRSSYTWALALRRGTLSQAGDATWSADEYEYKDDISTVVGRFGSINPEGLWP